MARDLPCGIGFSMASCSAYSTMNGVMMPAVSAGSSHVGASEMCTPTVSWPDGRGGLRRDEPRLAAQSRVAAQRQAHRVVSSSCIVLRQVLFR